MCYRLDFPLQLRLGDQLFPGIASDMSITGIGARFDARSDMAPALQAALACHGSGALEITRGGKRSVLRVRNVHAKSGFRTEIGRW